MAVRRQRATTSKEIMEKDINIAIKKAKQRFRYSKTFYILDYSNNENECYFASGYPDIDKITKQEVYKEKWVFNIDNKRWDSI
jgi:hypothetical protein